jgi:hypothetical protein
MRVCTSVAWRGVTEVAETLQATVTRRLDEPTVRLGDSTSSARIAFEPLDSTALVRPYQAG